METGTKNVDRAGVIAPPPLIYAFFFGLGYLLNMFFPIGEMYPEVLRLAGKVLSVIAVLIAITGVITMKRAGTHVDVYEATTKIVTNGPFRFSRNPLYVSLALLYIGIALYLPLFWALITLPVVLIIMRQGVIVREERYLEKKFGDEYIAYKKSTPRWLF